MKQRNHIRTMPKDRANKWNDLPTPKEVLCIVAFFLLIAAVLWFASGCAYKSNVYNTFGGAESWFEHSNAAVDAPVDADTDLKDNTVTLPVVP